MALTTKWPTLNLAAEWKGRHKIKPHNVRRAWDDYLGRFPWEWFCTLTFDPNRAHSKRDLVDREAFDWCNLTARTVRRPIGWVYAPERTRSGAWHAHVLMTGGIERRELRASEAFWRARNGILDIKAVWERRGVSIYTSKSASMAGTLVCSDTLMRYRSGLQDSVLVALHPAEPDAAIAVADCWTTREAPSCPERADD
ncbi:MAG: hypothetical protein U0Q55_16260 [Vicinamibacterales bacterium]